MNYENVTPSEKRILEEMRSLAPYEEMRVVADKNGIPDVYFTIRTKKTIITVGIVQSVPVNTNK